MTDPLVWSERPEPDGDALRDCTYSAGLQALVFGGKRTYKLGIYTAAEREALERSDNQPDETGASLDDLIVAVKTRYGIQWAKSAVELLDQHHARTDLAFVIQGRNGNLAAGHRLRRWDPDFTGAHAVTIIPSADGQRVTWLDPLAPNRYAGDTVEWVTVMRWIGSMPFMVIVREDAYAPPKPLAYTLHVAAHALVLIASVTPTGKISGWTSRRWGPTASTAPCRKPVVKKGTIRGEALVAYVISGAFKGQWVDIGGGVTVTSKETT